MIDETRIFTKWVVHNNEEVLDYNLPAPGESLQGS